MKIFKKITIFMVILLIIAIALFFIALNNISVNYPVEISDSKKIVTIQLDNSLGENIYSIKNNSDFTIYNENYIAAINESVSNFQLDNYNIKKPLIIYNLYGTNKLAFNIMFSTMFKTQVKYTISVEDPNIPDFSNILYNDTKNNLTKSHNYQIIGFVPGYKNTLKLELLNSFNKTIYSKNIEIDLTNISVYSEVILPSEQGTSASALSNGLYAVLGNQDKEQAQYVSKFYFSLYDNNGVIRSEIPTINYRADNLLFDNTIMYYSITPFNVVAVDNLGKVIQNYHMGQYNQHHDYTLDEYGDLLVLSTDGKSETGGDIVVKIDTKTKEVTKILDLKDYFGSYVDTCFQGEEAKLNWIHINSIDYANGDIYLSSRETSSILKIQDIYSTPKLKYILSAKELWKNTDLADLVYKKVGDFQIHGGQHSVKYVPTDKEYEYYLTFYNNNWGNQATQPNFDYKKLGFTNTFNKGDNSYYYMYKVNENEKTFELVDSLAVEYSAIVSSIRTMDNGNKVINSGCAGIFAEYDQSNNLIKKFSIKLNNLFVYRVFKYDFNNFWFINN